MASMPLLAALLLALSAPQADETRFDRVHLRNGNFLDGRIVKSSANEIVLKLTVGEMTVRRDLIERIEQVSMRSLTDDRRPPPPPPAPPRGATPPAGEREPAPAPADLQKRAAAILEELRRADFDSRPAVVEKFAALGDDGAVYLAGRLPDLDPATLPYVGAFLGRAKEPRTAPVLAGYLKHPKAAVRAVSASSLGQFGAAAPVPDLLPLLADSEAGVRLGALGAVRGLAPREAFVPVARLVMDPNAEVRTLAVETLFELARKHEFQRDLTSTLVPYLDRAGGPARATVAGAIGRAGDKAAWSALTPLLRDDSAEVRASAAQALEALGAPEAGEALIAAIATERETKPRLRLAAAVQKIRLVQAGKALIPWLDEEDAEIRTAALTALRGLTGKGFGPDRKAWETYWLSENPK